MIKIETIRCYLKKDGSFSRDYKIKDITTTATVGIVFDSIS